MQPSYALISLRFSVTDNLLEPFRNCNCSFDILTRRQNAFPCLTEYLQGCSRTTSRITSFSLCGSLLNNRKIYNAVKIRPAKRICARLSLVVNSYIVKSGKHEREFKLNETAQRREANPYERG